MYVQPIQLLSKLRHIHSPGDGAKSFFAFPEFSAPAECDIGKYGALPTCFHMWLPSSCKLLFPGSFASWLLTGLDRWEVLEGGWGVGEARVFLPLSLCLVGAGCPFSSTDYCLLVFGSYRATHSSVVQPRSGPGHDSATARQDRHHPHGLPPPGVAVASP